MSYRRRFSSVFIILFVVLLCTTSIKLIQMSFTDDRLLHTPDYIDQKSLEDHKLYTYIEDEDIQSQDSVSEPIFVNTSKDTNVNPMESKYISPPSNLNPVTEKNHPMNMSSPTIPKENKNEEVHLYGAKIVDEEKKIVPTAEKYLETNTAQESTEYKNEQNVKNSSTVSSRPLIMENKAEPEVNATLSLKRLWKQIPFADGNVNIKIRSRNLKKLFELEKVALIKKTTIPKFIHRIFMNPYTIDNTEKEKYMTDLQKDSLKDFETKNPGYHQFLWSLEDSHEFMEIFFPVYAESFKKLPKIVHKIDLFRYMLLAVVGGVYSDLNTYCLTPIDTWAEYYLKEQHNPAQNVSTMIGLEAKADPKLIPKWRNFWHRDIQLCLWTIASAPDTPFFKSIVNSMLGHVLSIPKEALDKYDVVDFAGVAIWSDLVLEWSKTHGHPKSEFYKIQKHALQIDSVLILPIYAFSPGPLSKIHSLMGVIDAGQPGTLVKHVVQNSLDSSA